MSNSLINLGDLSKPATVLIEKISDAVGGIFLPYQIKRVAKANAKAEKIRAVALIEIAGLQRRALARLLQEEATKQKNIESITLKALPNLNKESKPKDIEQDWLVSFFDKAKLISDSEMQDLWSKILSGEANAPGTFSKRTINMVASLDKKDASLFNSLSKFVWSLGEASIPLVFNTKDKIYTSHGINFEALKHLDSIGLISFESVSGYVFGDLPKEIKVFYEDRSVSISFNKNDNNELKVGLVILTNVGRDLIRICGVKKVDGFMEYVVDRWSSDNSILKGSIKANEA